MALVGNGTNLITSWIVMNDGRLEHGPFTEWRAARSAAMRIGDAIIGRNAHGEILTYDVVFSANQDISPRNPYHMIKRYRALAEQHNNQMWSIELSEAATLLEVLTNECIGRIAGAKRAHLEQEYFDAVAETIPTPALAPRRTRQATAPPPTTPTSGDGLFSARPARVRKPTGGEIDWPLRST